MRQLKFRNLGIKINRKGGDWRGWDEGRRGTSGNLMPGLVQEDRLNDKIFLVSPHRKHNSKWRWGDILSCWKYRCHAWLVTGLFGCMRHVLLQGIYQL